MSYVTCKCMGFLKCFGFFSPCLFKLQMLQRDKCHMKRCQVLWKFRDEALHVRMSHVVVVFVAHMLPEHACESTADAFVDS